MKNKILLRSIALLGYILSIIVLFLINKEKIASVFRYFVVVIGIIASIYFIPFSLIKSIKEDLTIKKYLIASDIIFYLIFCHIILIAIADNSIFEITGMLIMVINFIFCIIGYLKIENDKKEMRKLLNLHVLLNFLIPLIIY